MCSIAQNGNFNFSRQKLLLADRFNNEAEQAKQSLSDIFQHLNELNTEMQGRNWAIVYIGKKIYSFKRQLE